MERIAPSRPWRVAKPTREPGPPAFDEPLGPGTDVLPVRIQIFQDGRRTGWDDGAMGFEDGAVWFSGEACSFRLGAGDILPGTHRYSRRHAVSMAEAFEGFPLRHPEREVWVKVRVLDAEGRDQAADEARLLGEVVRLRGLSSGGGESQYPPLEPRPGIPLAEPPPSPAVRAFQAWGLTGLLLSIVVKEVHKPTGFAILVVATAFYLAAWRRQAQEKRARREAGRP